LSVERIPGKEYTFEVKFPAEGLNYQVDLKKETLRVNLIEVDCSRFSYHDLLNYHFRLGGHDIFIMFCQPSPDAKETVKFIIDGKPVYYEVPGKLTVWLEDSGEIASIHTGDDPGELTLTPEETFILAARNTKHSQKMAASSKRKFKKSVIRVPDQVLVEKEASKLIISWPWYDRFFNKDLVLGIVLVLLSISAWFWIFPYITIEVELIIFPLLFMLFSYWTLETYFVKRKIVIEGNNLEVRSGVTGFKKVSNVCLEDVEKFEQHKETSQRGTPYSQLCALMKSGEHKIIMSYQPDEVFAYLESELNLILHRNEHQPPE